MKLASVILDIPTQALDAPYTYSVPEAPAEAGGYDVEVGGAVLVPFGPRQAVGFIIGIEERAEGDWPAGLDPAKLKGIVRAVSRPYFDEEGAACAQWLSERYIAPLSSCVRLFTPPGGVPRMVRAQGGYWRLEEPTVGEVDDRWVVPGPALADFEPRKNAMKQASIAAALERGELRVGIAYTRGRAILPGILEAFAGVYPNVRVILTEERNHTLQNLLHEGRVDLAIARFQKPLPGIEVQPFYTEDTVLLVSRQLLQACGIDLAAHRAEIERGDLRALRGCPFVSGSAEDITGSLERDAFRRAGFVPEVRAESSNVETLLELCARGVGACFCPENLARLLLAAQPHGRLEMLRMPDTMAYPISFGYAKRAYPWSVLADFIRIARAQYPQPT